MGLNAAFARKGSQEPYRESFVGPLLHFQKTSWVLSFSRYHILVERGNLHLELTTPQACFAFVGLSVSIQNWKQPREATSAIPVKVVKTASLRTRSTDISAY